METARNAKEYLYKEYMLVKKGGLLTESDRADVLSTLSWPDSGLTVI